MKKGNWYTRKDCKHAKNEAAYASMGKESLLQLIVNGVVGGKCKKLVQFATLFHTLQHGKPMLEYNAHKELFDILNLENNPKMHWRNSTSWTMVQHMHEFMLNATIVVVVVA